MTSCYETVEDNDIQTYETDANDPLIYRTAVGRGRWQTTGCGDRNSKYNPCVPIQGVCTALTVVERFSA